MIRLVPHSGIQFVSYALDMEKAPRFSRNFIEHVQTQAAPGVPSKVELWPGWNDNDPEADPPYKAGPGRQRLRYFAGQGAGTVPQSVDPGAVSGGEALARRARQGTGSAPPIGPVSGFLRRSPEPKALRTMLCSPSTRRP